VFNRRSCLNDAEIITLIILIQVMHGGLFSEDGVTLQTLRNLERNRQPPDSGILCLLYSLIISTLIHLSSLLSHHPVSICFRVNKYYKNNI